ncbi:MAG TPA: hypothetical protein VGM90_20715 [Kofleriaceae bacterium]
MNAADREHPIAEPDAKVIRVAAARSKRDSWALAPVNAVACVETELIGLRVDHQEVAMNRESRNARVGTEVELFLLDELVLGDSRDPEDIGVLAQHARLPVQHGDRRTVSREDVAEEPILAQALDLDVSRRCGGVNRRSATRIRRHGRVCDRGGRVDISRRGGRRVRTSAGSDTNQCNDEGWPHDPHALTSYHCDVGPGSRRTQPSV